MHIITAEDTDERTFIDYPIGLDIPTALLRRALEYVGLENTNIEDLKELGHGTRGIAYELPGGKRVLKLTGDTSEAKAAFHLLDFDNQYICNFYDVFQLGEFRLYGIVQERLKKLDAKYYNIIEDYIEIMHGEVSEDAYEAYEDHLDKVDAIRTLTHTRPRDPDREIYLERFMHWLHGAAKELERSHIQYDDLTQDNIMQRPDGRIVLIDLGYSESPPAKIYRLKAAAALERAAQIVEAEDAEKNERWFFFKEPIYSYIDEPTHKALLKQVNATPNKTLGQFKILGSGNYGTAFDLGNGKVLKVTTDALEANSSVRLINQQNQTIATIYDVFEFDSTKGKKLFGIVQEKLLPATKSWVDLAAVWWIWRKEGGAPQKFDTPITPQNVEKFIAWYKNKGRELVEWVSIYYRLDVTMRFLSVKHAEWMRTAAQELETAGIKFRDLHWDNIMRRRDGQHVMIDLGLSRAAKTNIPKLLEMAASFISALFDVEDSEDGITVEILESLGCFSGFDEDENELDATQLHAGEWVDTTFDELTEPQKAALWQMIEKSYSGLEGGAPVKRPEDLLGSKYQLITLWDENDDNIPNAFRFQRKKPAGMKMFMSGTDGTPASRGAAKQKLVELLKQPGWYAELSDAPAHVAEKAGLRRWDDEDFVRKVLEGEEITWLGDGYYERDITGVGRHRKALYGRPYGKPLP